MNQGDPEWVKHAAPTNHFMQWLVRMHVVLGLLHGGLERIKQLRGESVV